MNNFFLSFLIFPILAFGSSPFIGLSTGICVYKNSRANEYNSNSEEIHRFRFWTKSLYDFRISI
jgi:hypothetical protein